MLFSVAIYCDDALHWTCVVEAEDCDGAIREAMTALRNGGGLFSSRKRHAASISVQVEAMPRNYRTCSISELMGVCG